MIFPAMIGLLALAPSMPADEEVSALTDADVASLVEELSPAPNRKWREIPWDLSLTNGQAMAAESKKPLFVWAMDGHPLGCT